MEWVGGGWRTGGGVVTGGWKWYWIGLGWVGIGVGLVLNRGGFGWNGME